MKKKINIILYIILFLFAGLVIFLACHQSNQAIMSMPMPLQFVGEYSQDGGEWQTLSGETDLSACDGDLVLRGRFDPDLQEGTQIKLYLNHIGMNISINGECIFESSMEQYPDMWRTQSKSACRIHTAMGTVMHTMNFWIPCL